MSRSKQIRYLSAILVSIIVLISGCGDDNSSQKSQPKTSSKPVGSIEIVSNENAKEIKVAPKKQDANGSQNKSYYYDYNIKASMI